MGGDARGRLGWAVAGEDENVNELERRGAATLGKEAAVFVPTCSPRTSSRCSRRRARGGRAALDRARRTSRRQRGRLAHRARAALSPLGLDEAGSPPTSSASRTRTRGAAGRCSTPEAHRGARGTARRGRTSTAPGCRTRPSRSACRSRRSPRRCDTVALSLNKGLCAPFGALLAGDGETIAAARVAPEAARRRKRAQGGDLRRGRARRARADASTASPTTTAARASSRRLIGAEPSRETNIVYADLGPGAVDALARPRRAGARARRPRPLRHAPPDRRRRGGAGRQRPLRAAR